METVKQMQNRHQKELNEFKWIFFAFNQNQLKEGLLKVGLKEGDTDKILSIDAGGFVRKDRKYEFLAMFERHRQESLQMRKNQKTIDIVFAGVNSWGNPIFKTVEKPHRYYGSTVALFDYDATEKQVLNQIDEDALCYFGNRFDSEPMGSNPGNIKILSKV